MGYCMGELLHDAIAQSAGSAKYNALHVRQVRYQPAQGGLCDAGRIEELNTSTVKGGDQDGCRLVSAHVEPILRRGWLIGNETSRHSPP